MTKPPPVPPDNQSHKGTGDRKSGNAHEVQKGRGHIENPREQGQPGNTAQHWTASSARIRHELGYREPVTMEEAIRRTICWERENPPAETLLAKFDYAAEDAAIDSHHLN